MARGYTSSLLQATLHDNTIAHGVTAHERGVRYGLFLLREPGVPALALATTPAL